PVGDHNAANRLCGAEGMVMPAGSAQLTFSYHALMAIRAALHWLLSPPTPRRTRPHDCIPSTGRRGIRTARRELDRVTDLIFVLLHSQPPILILTPPFFMRRRRQASRAYLRLTRSRDLIRPRGRPDFSAMSRSCAS